MTNTAVVRSRVNATEGMLLFALMVALGLLNALLMYFKGPYFVASEGISGTASIVSTYAGLIIGAALAIYYGRSSNRWLMVITTIAAVAGLGFLTVSLLQA